MYARGRQLALIDYGLTKTAFNWAALRSAAADGGSVLRNLMVGAPGTIDAIKRQARTGTLFKPSPSGNPMESGMYHNPFGWLIPNFNFGPKGSSAGSRAPYAIETALSVLNPVQTAYGAYQVLSAPPEYRGEAIGNFAGSMLGSTALAPFGILGQYAGGAAGADIGARIGRRFNTQSDPAQGWES